MHELAHYRTMPEKVDSIIQLMRYPDCTDVPMSSWSDTPNASGSAWHEYRSRVRVKSSSEPSRRESRPPDQMSYWHRSTQWQ